MGYHILVLAGGSGTRLWPLSRSAVPKHLLPLDASGMTLLRATVERVLPLADQVHVVTAATQAQACRRELAGLPLSGEPVIAEPAARGTGPALGLATLWIAARDPEAVISSVHADAHVDDPDAYRAAVLAAAGWAASTGGIATVGIVPAYASTGLGYVAVGEGTLEPRRWGPPEGGRAGAATRAAAAALPAFPALGFVEKPTPEVARGFVSGGRHLWNSGLFAWSAAAFEAELRSADPALAARIDRAVAALGRGAAAEAEATYAAIQPVPVDTLVMERTRRLTVVRGAFTWSDVGGFADLHRVRRAAGGADARGNVLEGDVLEVDARESLVLARGGRPVAVVGVEGLAVVDSGDAVLVLPLDQAQRVREIVERIKALGRDDLL